MTLVIHDEALAQKVRERAKAVGKSTDEFIREAVEGLPVVVEAKRSEMPEALKRVRRKAYVKARDYWAKHGDAEKSALSDDELDDNFERFDAEGIPRLKGESYSLPESEAGTLAALVKSGIAADIHTGRTDISENADAILDKEFADYLVRRARGENV